MIAKLHLLFGILASVVLLDPAFAKVGDACDGSSGTGKCALTCDCTTGFTFKGACPNDAANVLCCVKSTCAYGTVNYFTTNGNCYDINVNTCTDGFYVQGQCRGGNNVQCCVPNAPASYIHKIYDKALAYKNSHPTTTLPSTANELVVGWLRHPTYDKIEWTVLIRGIDQTWIQWAQDQGLSRQSTFPDPKYNVQFPKSPIEYDHLGASLDGAFHKGMSHAGTVSGEIANYRIYS